MPRSSWQAIVLDLGNVVFEWSSEPAGEARATLKSIMKSDIYAQYETGQTGTEDEFYDTVGQQLGVDPTHIETTFQNARASLQVNSRLVEFIRELKQTTGITVYAMSNIPQSDMEYLQREHPSAMEIFYQVFASGFVGLRKPDLGFFRMVTEKSRLLPERMVFVDDKTENVDAARKVGLCGIRFESTDGLFDRLRDLILSD